MREAQCTSPASVVAVVWNTTSSWLPERSLRSMVSSMRCLRGHEIAGLELASYELRRSLHPSLPTSIASARPSGASLLSGWHLFILTMPPLDDCHRLDKVASI